MDASNILYRIAPSRYSPNSLAIASVDSSTPPCMFSFVNCRFSRWHMGIVTVLLRLIVTFTGGVVGRRIVVGPERGERACVERRVEMRMLVVVSRVVR